MYSRDFGSVKSDGNLDEMREAMRREDEHASATATQYRYDERQGDTGREVRDVYRDERQSDREVRDVYRDERRDDSREVFGGDRRNDCRDDRRSLLSLDFLRNIEIDDLILIAIGVLLLLDSDSSNDFIIILIAAMLLF